MSSVPLMRAAMWYLDKYDIFPDDDTRCTATNNLKLAGLIMEVQVRDDKGKMVTEYRPTQGLRLYVDRLKSVAIPTQKWD